MIFHINRTSNITANKLVLDKTSCSRPNVFASLSAVFIGNYFLVKVKNFSPIYRTFAPIGAEPPKTEIDDKIKQIESNCKNVDMIGDDEIIETKNNIKVLDDELRDLRDMRDKFETYISDFIDKDKLIKDLAEKYKTINDAVMKHKDKLKTEIKKRELEDYKLKAVANLNIELPKFNGTDHKIDIYSFQTKFEEEHSRLPKTKCVYQLKEKFLTGAAKEMVKSIDDLDDIWKVLKEAFGDPKVLLNNELELVKKLGPLTRIKDNQELSIALSRLANAMENLSKTAEKHSIQYELYNRHSETLIYEI